MKIIEQDFTILTERCRLRIPSEADFSTKISATRHLRFNDGMPWDPPATESDLLTPLRRTLERWQTGKAFDFTIDRLSDCRAIERVSIRKEELPGVWNMGFWLHPDFQGCGFMTEAAAAIVAFGFDTLHADVVQARHATWNLKSRRVLERIGMHQVAYISQGFQKRGKWVDEYRMEISRKA